MRWELPLHRPECVLCSIPVRRTASTLTTDGGVDALAKGKQQFPPAHLPAVVPYKAIVEALWCVSTVHARNSIAGLDNATYLLP